MIKWIKCPPQTHANRGGFDGYSMADILLVHAQSVLDLVANRAGGTAVVLVVFGALGLVKGRLASGLVIVGLNTAGNAVAGVSEGLLDLLLGGLGGVRSDFLLGLGREILATGVRHIDGWCGLKVVLKSFSWID